MLFAATLCLLTDVQQQSKVQMSEIVFEHALLCPLQRLLSTEFVQPIPPPSGSSGVPCNSDTSKPKAAAIEMLFSRNYGCDR